MVYDIKISWKKILIIVGLIIILFAVAFISLKCYLQGNTLATLVETRFQRIEDNLNKKMDINNKLLAIYQEKNIFYPNEHSMNGIGIKNINNKTLVYTLKITVLSVPSEKSRNETLEWFVYSEREQTVLAHELKVQRIDIYIPPNVEFGNYKFLVEIIPINSDITSLSEEIILEVKKPLWYKIKDNIPECLK